MEGLDPNQNLHVRVPREPKEESLLELVTTEALLAELVNRISPPATAPVDTWALVRQLETMRHCYSCTNTNTVLCTSCIWRDVWEMGRHIDNFKKENRNAKLDRRNAKRK